MLSYNWESQELVKKVYEYLIKKDISVWMDIKGGMKVDMITSMSSAVQGAKIVSVGEFKKHLNARRRFLRVLFFAIIFLDRKIRRSRTDFFFSKPNVLIKFRRNNDRF